MEAWAPSAVLPPQPFPQQPLALLQDWPPQQPPFFADAFPHCIPFPQQPLPCFPPQQPAAFLPIPFPWWQQPGPLSAAIFSQHGHSALGVEGVLSGGGFWVAVCAHILMVRASTNASSRNFITSPIQQCL
jgi:hypothetical protein